MHFYTYDEWLADSYYTKDSTVLLKNETKVYDLSDPPGRYLTIRSCWSNISYISNTIDSSLMALTPYHIDCDIGCLWKLTGEYYSGRKGCIQEIDDMIGNIAETPWIEINDRAERSQKSGIVQVYYDNFNDQYKKILTIDLNYQRQMSSILIFQSIYSGAISFQDATTNLEFFFSDYYGGNSNYDYQTYDFKINTEIYCNDSLMVVGALLTFDHNSYGDYLIIESLCQPVYGHVDMDMRYNWGLRWNCFKPPAGAALMPESLMHYTKHAVK